MKFYHKIAAVLTMLAIASVILIGCTNTDIPGPEPIDNSRTQLSIGNYDGGFGKNWLINLKNGFEELYKDIEFEKDKKGVQLIIDHDKDKYDTKMIVNTISNSSTEVYFSTGQIFDEFVDKSLLLELTDAVRENLGDKFGEDKTIEGKIPAEYKNYYNMRRNDKYYVLPSINSTVGIVYDVDLFDLKQLFFAKNGAPSEALQEGGFFSAYRTTNLAGARSAGPDGKYGTYDDGMPATYEEFFWLCGMMKKTYAIDPISFTGKYKKPYSEFLARALWADYEGAERASLQYSAGAAGYNTADILDFDSNGSPVITAHTINTENYNLLAKQPGRYYSLEFWQNIIKNNYYTTLSLNSSQTHGMAQWDFLHSRTRNDMNDIAMILEGTWWLNEAEEAGVFSTMRRYGEDFYRENRRFAFMPMPKVNTDKIGEKVTLYSFDSGGIFVNANIAEHKKPIAKAFVQYALLDSSLVQFTADTGALRAYNYAIDAQTYSSLDYFTRSFIDINNPKNPDDMPGKVNTFYYSKEIRSAIQKSQESLDGFISNVNDKDYNIFVDALRDNITARQYFEGFYNKIKK